MRTLVTMLTAASLLSPAWSQSQGNSTPDQDTVVLYIAFFQQLKMFEALAAHDPDPVRSRKLIIQNESQLTDAEYAQVKAIAFDCNAARDAIAKQLTDVDKAFKSQNPGAVGYSPAVGQQIGALRRLSNQTSVAHIQQLKDALGEARFQQFDAFVHKKIGPTMGKPRAKQ